MAVRRKKARELRLVIDTNVAFTQGVSDLVNPELRDTILSNSSHSDLNLKWFMPDVVIMERRYRMIERAKSLLPALEKIERLLGHNLGITANTLEDGVGRAVDSQLGELGIQKLGIRNSDVDWCRLIQDAAMRRPPFEAGEKEKGFRDALILEAFCQLHGESPKSPAVCRVILVTNDALLADAARIRLAASQNFQIVAGLEELRSLVNTLASEVDEEFVNDLRNKAAKLFFESGAQETLWYKDRIGERIRGTYGEKLKELPPGAQYSRPGKIRLSPTRFIKKSGQRVHWATQVTFELEALKKQPKYRNVLAELAGSGASPSLKSLLELYAQPSLSEKTATPAISGMLSTGGVEEEEIFVKTGKVTFDIMWSSTVARRKTLGRATVDSIQFVEIEWG